MSKKSASDTKADEALKEANKAKDAYKKQAEEATKKYEKQAEEANKAYKEQAEKASQAYADTAKKTTGQAGFNKSLEMGARGANLLAGGAQQQAQNAYRNAGLNKAQAAQLAGGQANQAFQQGFQGQQAQGANQLANQLNAAGNLAGQQLGTAGTLSGNVLNTAGQGAGQRLNAYGTGLGFQGNLTGQQLGEAQAQHNRFWNNFGNWVGGAAELGKVFTSDERLKVKVPLDEQPVKKTARDYSSLVGESINRLNNNGKKENRFKDLFL